MSRLRYILKSRAGNVRRKRPGALVNPKEGDMTLVIIVIIVLFAGYLAMRRRGRR